MESNLRHYLAMSGGLEPWNRICIYITLKKTKKACWCVMFRRAGNTFCAVLCHALLSLELEGKYWTKKSPWKRFMEALGLERWD